MHTEDAEVNVAAPPADNGENLPADRRVDDGDDGIANQVGDGTDPTPNAAVGNVDGDDAGGADELFRIRMLRSQVPRRRLPLEEGGVRPTVRRNEFRVEKHGPVGDRLQHGRT